MDWNEEEFNDGLTDEQRRTVMQSKSDGVQLYMLFTLAMAHVWSLSDTTDVEWVRSNEKLLLDQGIRKNVIDRYCEAQKPFDYMDWFKSIGKYKSYSLDNILSEPQYQKKVKFPTKPEFQRELTEEEKADWEYFNLQMLVAYMSEEELEEFRASTSKETKTVHDWGGLKDRLKDHHIPSKPILVYQRPDGGYDSVSQDPNCALPPFKHKMLTGATNGIYPVRGNIG